MASRESYLIFSEARTEFGDHRVEGEVLYHSVHGVPLLWLFCFGGRNVWEPGDDVMARGGAVGKRNPFETKVEVALSRLEGAQDALEVNAHVWTWLSAMPILMRKLTLQKKTGLVRLVAPWMANLPKEEQERWRSATAFVENFVNFLAADRRTEAAESIRRLTPYCPFIPEGHGVDRKRFDKLDLYRDEDEAMKLALLTLGEPKSRDLLQRAVERDVAPALEAYKGLKPLEAPRSSLIKVPATHPVEGSKAPQDSEGGGLLDKLTGIFRKK